MSSVMTVNDLCLWYGSAQALKDINMKIEERSITALIGPSGCGKSTFLKSLNRMERTIEALCLKLLLQQQPVAGDLRQISAALKMITDMERIGTQAADIAEIITFLDGRTGEECEQIRFMADAASRMVTESIDAFVKQDVYLAGAAIERDDVVDDLFLQVKSSLIKLIAEKTADGGYALDLLMIAKYFERIGDHAVNIAEWVTFSVTGEHT